MSNLFEKGIYRELTNDQKKDMIDIRDRTSWKKTKLTELDEFTKKLTKDKIPFCRTCMVNEIDKLHKRVKDAMNEAATLGRNATIDIKGLSKVNFEQFSKEYDEKTDKGWMIFKNESIITKPLLKGLPAVSVTFRDYKCKRGHGMSFEQPR